MNAPQESEVAYLGLQGHRRLVASVEAAGISSPAWRSVSSWVVGPPIMTERGAIKQMSTLNRRASPPPYGGAVVSWRPQKMCAPGAREGMHRRRTWSRRWRRRTLIRGPPLRTREASGPVSTHRADARSADDAPRPQGAGTPLTPDPPCVQSTSATTIRPAGGGPSGPAEPRKAHGLRIEGRAVHWDSLDPDESSGGVGLNLMTSGHAVAHADFHGTTVTGHFAERTSRTATEPTSLCPAFIEAPTTTASALRSSAILSISAAGSPEHSRNSAVTECLAINGRMASNSSCPAPCGS